MGNPIYHVPIKINLPDISRNSQKSSAIKIFVQLPVFNHTKQIAVAI